VNGASLPGSKGRGSKTSANGEPSHPQGKGTERIFGPLEKDGAGGKKTPTIQCRGPGCGWVNNSNRIRSIKCERTSVKRIKLREEEQKTCASKMKNPLHSDRKAHVSPS